MNLHDIRHLFDYTEWANDLAMEAADELPDDDLRRDTGISHKSILGTLTHMAGAEWIWLERWHGVSITDPNVWLDWTTERCRSLAELRAKWQPIIDKRNVYISRLNNDELPRDLSFKRLNGEQYSMPLVHQMQHVVN